MELARITARGRATIPKRVLEASGLRKGDVIAFEIEGDNLVVRKVSPGQHECLGGVPSTLSEWASPEDEDAWRDL